MNRIAALCVGLAALLAWAEQPDEATLFGSTEPLAPSGATDAGTLGAVQAPPEATPPSAEALPSFEVTDAFERGERKEDPLQLGGMFYERLAAAHARNAKLQDTTLSLPTLVDGYLDARPNDRVRGMLVARLKYDPTLDPAQLSFFAAAAPPNPSVGLDQLWLRFDVARAVFVTAGKQHVKWGTARFWNPTDFLHPDRRDPLAQFDAREGATMLKVHVPWESRGWNLYALGLLDNAGPANALGEVGGAVRGELVVGTVEAGAEGVWVKGKHPRYGADVSAGVGPIDLYGEVALRKGVDAPRYRLADSPDFTQGVDGLFEVERPEGVNVATSGGLSWTWAYSDNDTLTLGGEYFYQSLGYTDPNVYPYLLYKGALQPFYVGRQYAGVYALLAGPGSWDKTTFVASNLGNLSDQSYVSRLDFNVRVLTDLLVEAYAAVHYGTTGGEFRWGFDTPELVANGQVIPAIHVPAPLLDLGVGLRINL